MVIQKLIVEEEKMPELPEMETYKTLLQQFIGGQTITKAMVTREKSVNLSTEQFIGFLIGYENLFN
ncbi:DNA-formamidopyrimidine glycosylase family protein [Pueribacillus theae]